MLYEVGSIIAQLVLALLEDQQTDIIINNILPLYLLLCRILQTGSSKGWVYVLLILILCHSKVLSCPVMQDLIIPRNWVGILNEKGALSRNE